MPVVTALRATRRGAVALHVDGEFVFTVSEALLAKWRLFKGRELTEDDVDALRAQASSERIRRDAYRLLEHRSRSRGELRRRLVERGHDEHGVAAVLDSLTADGLVDDADFARKYVADKRGLAAWGTERIRRGLAAAEIDTALIQSALAEGDQDAETAEVARALALLERRGRPRPPLEAERRRAYQALMRRGFSGAVAYAAVQRWSGDAPLT